MLNDDRTMKSSQARTAFPLAEGVGIFVGIASWYLLSDGQLAIAKSLAVATPLHCFGTDCAAGKTVRATSKHPRQLQSVTQTPKKHHRHPAFPCVE